MQRAIKNLNTEKEEKCLLGRNIQGDGIDQSLIWNSEIIFKAVSIMLKVKFMIVKMFVIIWEQNTIPPVPTDGPACCPAVGRELKAQRERQ